MRTHGTRTDRSLVLGLDALLGSHPNKDLPMVGADDFTAWLRETCDTQGVGLTIEDPDVLSMVERLIKGGHE